MRISFTTVGERSTKTSREKCFPAPASKKRVVDASSSPLIVLSMGINNFQHALPTWMPTCPGWMQTIWRTARVRGARLCAESEIPSSTGAAPVHQAREYWGIIADEHREHPFRRAGRRRSSHQTGAAKVAAWRHPLTGPRRNDVTVEGSWEASSKT